MTPEKIESLFGARCPDHDPDCPICVVWEAHDASQRQDSLIAALKKHTLSVAARNSREIVRLEIENEKMHEALRTLQSEAERPDCGNARLARCVALWTQHALEETT